MEKDRCEVSSPVGKEHEKKKKEKGEKKEVGTLYKYPCTYKHSPFYSGLGSIPAVKRGLGGSLVGKWSWCFFGWFLPFPFFFLGWWGLWLLLPAHRYATVLRLPLRWLSVSQRAGH